MGKKWKLNQSERNRRSKQAKLYHKYKKKQKQIFLECNEDYQNLLKEYKKNKREIINKTKINLEEILLNVYLFCSKPIIQKKNTAFNYFYDLGVINKASVMDFGGLKISQKYFDNMMK